MAQEINLGGTIYISSKRGAEITGYTQDYVGQLARAGSIVAQRVSGLWYVVEASLKEYKVKADEFVPQPPKLVQAQVELEASVSFDGKDYISAQRAAKITGYHQDYVGQLARTGKVLSRLIGSRWYVDREGIIEHKKFNDDLLAAVQVESVGLRKEPGMSIDTAQDNDLHFSYVNEPISHIESTLPEKIEQEAPIELESDVVNEIPIRIIHQPVQHAPKPHQDLTESYSGYAGSKKVMIIGGIALGLLSIIAGGYLYTTRVQTSDATPKPEARNNQYVTFVNAKGISEKILQYRESYIPPFILNASSNDVKMRRDSF